MILLLYQISEFFPNCCYNSLIKFLIRTIFTGDIVKYRTASFLPSSKEELQYPGCCSSKCHLITNFVIRQFYPETVPLSGKT